MSAPPARRPLVPVARPRRACVTLATLVLCGFVAAGHAAPPFRGRSVEAVIRELADDGGLQLVYTRDLVPTELVVQQEPTATAPVAAIGQVLASSGLALRQVDGRTYAVVRVARAATAKPESAASALDEVVVTSSRYSLAADVPDVHTLLTQDELVALPRLAEDTLKAVHRLPGAASNGLAGLAHLRGGEANETLVLLDGLPLYEPFHLRLLQSPASVLDERIVEGLDAYAGGFTADFGDRMSGIIDARSRHPEADAYYELGLSLMHANALASRSFAAGRGRWLASFRRSNLDEIADTLQSELGEPTYADGFARLDYAWSPSTRGSLHLLLASDEAQINNAAETESSDAEYSNSYLWGTLAHDWTPRLTTTALLSYTDVSARRVATVDEPGLRSGAAYDERDYDVLGLRLDAKYAAGRTLHRAGLDLRSLEARYQYRGEVTSAPGYPFPGASDFVRELSPAPGGEHVALYYTVRAQLTDALTGELGLRWDEQTYGPDSDDQLGPRVNLAWRLDERTRLLASWGRHQQFQGIEELQVEDGVEEFQRAQRAEHAILGLERELGPDVSLRVEAYRKDYTRLRTRYENLYDPLSLAPELRWDRVAVDPASARADGVEVLLTHRPAGDWSGWASYAWSRVVDRLDGADVRRSWDQTHTLNAGFGWMHGPWQATVAAQYHTGWPVTPIGLDATGSVEVGARNDHRYAHFGSLDARLSHDWTLAHGTLTAHAEVTNALDRRNPCCTDLAYGADGTLTRDLRHWLPLVPSIGVLWKF
ncbi:MAG TPA: TonB-dependent receptor [Steroidobacteraceae bacterium]|nr:TonB-dependent receptor [Steroidobacteraceae bacterium]